MKFRILVLFVLVQMAAAVAYSQTTAFSHQGKLNNSGNPANGNFDFEFKLFDTASGGTQQGATAQRLNVAVANGIFTVSLDFGAGVLPGADRFLDISVRNAGGGAFTPLSPRQPVTSAPYAVRSLNAGTATDASNLGGVPAGQYLQANGNGSGLTNLNASSITTGTLANARIGQITNANIADAAITGPKIGGGHVVKTLNGLTDNVSLAAGSNISITPSGNTLTIASTGGAGVGGSGTTNTIPLWTAGTTLGNSVMTQTADGRIGIGTPGPSAKLGVEVHIGSGNGVYGYATVGAGVNGDTISGTGVFGNSLTGIGVNAFSLSQGSIALRTGGSSWFKGDSTPLSAANTGTGTGIVIGSAGTFGYIQAYDYSANQARTLLLNNSGGSVGIGTSTPDQTLTVIGNASKPGGGSWLAFSDERLKNIKGRFNGGLKAVMKLQPLRYEYKKDNAIGLKSDGEHVGFSAQAVEKIIPEAVTKTEQGYPPCKQRPNNVDNAKCDQGTARANRGPA